MNPCWLINIYIVCRTICLRSAIHLCIRFGCISLNIEHWTVSKLRMYKMVIWKLMRLWISILHQTRLYERTLIETNTFHSFKCQTLETRIVLTVCCRRGLNRFSCVGYEANQNTEILMADVENYTWYAYQKIIIHIKRFETCSGDFIGFLVSACLLPCLVRVFEMRFKFSLCCCFDVKINWPLVQVWSELLFKVNFYSNDAPVVEWNLFEFCEN